MKLAKAMEMIQNKPTGYMVHFEWCGNGLLTSDYFPDKLNGEDLIPTEDEAWMLANRFAMATRGKTCNLYVVGRNFSPVESYKDRQILNR